MMMHHKAKLLYDEYHRIDLIMRGNLQRRIRRVWLKYKHKKAEKARKKKEAAAAKKGKFGVKKKKAPAPAAPKPAVTSPTKPSPDKASTGAGPEASKAVSEVQSDPSDPLSQTMVNINLKQTLGVGDLDLQKQNTITEGMALPQVAEETS